MGIPLYLAFLPEQNLYSDLAELKNVLPKGCVHKARVDCLGEVLAKPLHLSCPHISVLDGYIPLPETMKKFERSMIKVAGLIPPRLPITMYPQVCSEVNEMWLVPDLPSDKALREIRESLIGLLGARLKFLEYRPHVSLAALKFGTDSTEINRSVGAMRFVFKILSVHCCSEGFGEKAFVNTFRPRKFS